MAKIILHWKVSFLVLLVLLTACSSVGIPESELVGGNASVEDVAVEGKLIEVGNNRLLIERSDGSEVRLLLSDDSVYWDGNDWMMKTPAVEDDQILAYGRWQDTGINFDVQRYYANRVDLQGIVFYVCGETEAFMVDQPDQDYIILPLPQKTELRTESPADPTSYKYFDLMPNFGEELQVVGREIEEPFLIAVVMTRMD